MYVDDLDSLELRAKGIYEEKETAFIKSFIKPDMVCLDIGANIGYFTIIMARLAKHVYAFEPEDWNYNTLCKNLELNSIANVSAFKYAVGQDTGITGGADHSYTTLYKCPTNGGMHRIYNSSWCRDGDKQHNVPLVALDSIIGSADFIKMDIEGAEYGALLGMERILREGTTLLMEFHGPSIMEYGVRPKRIYDYLLSLGYNISLIDKQISWNKLGKMAMHTVGINLLCTK